MRCERRDVKLKLSLVLEFFLAIILLPPKKEVMFLHLSVCLSVCLSARLL